MKIWLFIVAALVLMFGGCYVYALITAKPHWVYLHSLGNDGKTLTVFYPKVFMDNNEMYIIPGKWTSSSLPDTNYVKTHPNSQMALQVNWLPNDGRDLKFEFPIKNDNYEIHLDTSRYMVFDFIDKGDTFHSPKYRGFEYYEWITGGPNDHSPK
ncbi:hypothetical protein [Puia dinghuensis]|uniref:Uncharacterized protein n=1 Tax=Puia dinghuensis TaxID=1792502 RepID=A0A8J2U8X9_9BACT|nr:hypothetical protein [Puia dinghuensis]GGA86926.1 hypothetical protein GCM10011511_07500 [Puia dinghuensis]